MKIFLRNLMFYTSSTFIGIRVKSIKCQEMKRKKYRYHMKKNSAVPFARKLRLFFVKNIFSGNRSIEFHFFEFRMYNIKKEIYYIFFLCNISHF